jgi:hypothetical protein
MSYHFYIYALSSSFCLNYSFNNILLCSWFLQAVLATGRGLRRFGPAFGGLALGLFQRCARAVAGRGPRRYRPADLPDPLAEEEEIVELAPRHQALLDLWGGDTLPLQVEKEAEARWAEKSADQVCKSLILFNISLA